MFCWCDYPYAFMLYGFMMVVGLYVMCFEVA